MHRDGDPKLGLPLCPDCYDYTGALSPQAVANYIAKYATKDTGAAGLPHRPLPDQTAIDALPCSDHHKRLITTCRRLGKDPDLAILALNRWTHTLGYRGHFLTKSRRYSVTFTQLRRARIDYRRTQRHPGGERDPWGRPLDDRIVLKVATWTYAGTGHATTAERQFALAAPDLTRTTNRYRKRGGRGLGPPGRYRGTRRKRSKIAE